LDQILAASAARGRASLRLLARCFQIMRQNGHGPEEFTRTPVADVDRDETRLMPVAAISPTTK
jgi:hypothetical protein